MFFKF